MRRSLSLTESRSRSALSPIPAGWPLTVTRPSRISSSALRREAMPARARIFCSRCSLIARPWLPVENETLLALSPLHLGRCGRRSLLLAHRLLVVFRRLPIGRGLGAGDPLRLPGRFATLPVLRVCRLPALVELRRFAQEALFRVVLLVLEQTAVSGLRVDRRGRGAFQARRGHRGRSGRRGGRRRWQYRW